MLRRVIDGGLRVLARLRPPIRGGRRPLKVNLGGGIEVAEGWTNADGDIHALLSSAPPAILSRLYRRTTVVSRIVSEEEYLRRLRSHDFVFCDLERRLPFPTDSADYVFCSHVLEHFPPLKADHLLREVLRILKPGGWARICVPDLAHAFSLYQQGAREQALEFFFTGDRSRFAQHHYMYDAHLLTELLRKHGFVDVTQRSYREGEVPDLDRLDNRPEQTLYVEGRKPAA